MKLFNLARMTSATEGTGTLSLGDAVVGCLTFADAGVEDGDLISYGISDGANSEVGHGTYISSGTALSRDTVYSSTNGGAKINCSGSEQVYLTVLAQDISLAHDMEAPSGGAVWFDAGTLTGNHGDSIATWADQSGNNLDATQGTAGSQPTLDKTTFTQPTVYFSGNKVMSMTRPVADDFTIIIVLASTNTDGASADWYQNKGIFGNEVGGVQDDWAVTWDGGSVSFGTGNPDSSIRGAQFIADGLFHVVTVQRQKTGGFRSLFIDGVIQLFSRGNTNSLSAGASTYLGAFQAAAGYFTGWIAEVFVTSTVLSNSTRVGIENYYKDKYGI